MSVQVERHDGLVDYFDDEVENADSSSYRGVLYSYEVDAAAEGLRIIREFHGWDADQWGPALQSTQEAAYYRSSQWSTVKRS